MDRRLLIIDDDESIRWVLRSTFEKAGYEVYEASDGIRGSRMLADTGIPVALVDIKMPGMSGLELLEKLGSLLDETSIIIMTAEDTMDNAIAAMKRGAFDYVTKPFELDELEVVVDKAMQNALLARENLRMRREIRERYEIGVNIVGRHERMREIYKTIGRVAASNATVLITGESGTGKELIARSIHAHGPRVTGPFVAVNMTAIPSELLESELFGHEKGAFTGATDKRLGKFAEAQGGTLFLDEVGDMPPGLQAKILRVLQEREYYSVGSSKTQKVDVRIVAATNKVLQDEVASGRFREDLYYRLAVVPIHLPPLRERREDIALLLDYFLEKTAQERGAPKAAIEPRTVARLVACDWPGNVRQLENAVTRACLLSPSTVLRESDFPELREPGAGRPGALEGDFDTVVLAEARAQLENFEAAGRHDLHEVLVARVERPMIIAALERTGGNQIRAAEILGINRNTLRAKIRKLGVEMPR
ncbi:MAG: sigma-54-dependent Fis family transcriptional regulator [Myxococcales bacterium]|nr:sigma-54-dependent Fis family transcriptional regulator [Myxococcales bacterium]